MDDAQPALLQVVVAVHEGVAPVAAAAAPLGPRPLTLTILILGVHVLDAAVLGHPAVPGALPGVVPRVLLGVGLGADPCAAGFGRLPGAAALEPEASVVLSVRRAVAAEGEVLPELAGVRDDEVGGVVVVVVGERWREVVGGGESRGGDVGGGESRGGDVGGDDVVVVVVEELSVLLLQVVSLGVHQVPLQVGRDVELIRLKHRTR